MPRKPTTKPTEMPVADYRYASKRKNNPPAGLAIQGRVSETPRLQFSYDPHLPPSLRFDPTGGPDTLSTLIDEACIRPLKPEEAHLLKAALAKHEPWLEWAGKREAKSFEVDPVALHIHERVSAQAILKVAQRQTVQRSLFADPELDYRQAVQFYQHDVDWANRLILGDSLQVMASLARRESLAGQVQMIYVDPPYGIKFASNFQPEIGKRDVKDKESDLTREPEVVKAYRDTWTLGIHSYLAYLRDRLILCRELLADTGSIFVQIGDENLHRVRCLLDEVFGRENFVAVVAFRKTGGFPSGFLASVYDYLIWYAKNKFLTKFHQIYLFKINSGTVDQYRHVDDDGCQFEPTSLFSDGATAGGNFAFSYRGRAFHAPPNSHWKTSLDCLKRLEAAERLWPSRNMLRYVRYLDDFPVVPLANVWDDTMGEREMMYAVQTATKIIERCILMTTDPGDLVLDPTCGSGTTAYVAEQWGRRWITIDTSRVALALARQRLLTAAFLFYKVKGEEGPGDTNGKGSNPAKGFVYKTVPHITLKSIAQNVALDPIFAKHQPILDTKLAALNEALKTVTKEVRHRLLLKLQNKEQREGKRAITEADRRRWLLPPQNRAQNAYTTVPNDFPGWYEWEVPYDADDEWPEALKAALADYRVAWRAKMDEVNACIAANAEPEELVDQPEVVKGIVRVSGPFTVEAVMPAEESLEGASPIGGAPEALETFGGSDGADGQAGITTEPANAEAYLDKMLRLLKADGVRFPNNKVLTFTRLEPRRDGDSLHAEGEWQTEDEQTRRVAVSFGPQHGPVTAYQVEQALRMAYRRGYDDLIFAGFSFDAAAQAAIQEDPHPQVRCHLAHIRPDVQMGDLLKQTPNSQLFTVFGSPRTELRRRDDGFFEIEMQGVDIYNPVDNTVLPTSADKVAAWFLDTDYDGRTFCITQAFFPDKSAWEKLARALKGSIDEECFAALSGTVSLPFPAGQHRCAAVKVIDPRGNEVMRVHQLDDEVRYGR